MLIADLTEKFLAYCSRHLAPATVAFYRARLKRFCERFNSRELASLTPLEIDEHLAKAGTGMSDSTRHHDAVALRRLQKFALEHKLLDQPVFGNLEKPRVGRRDRVPTAAETEAIRSGRQDQTCTGAAPLESAQEPRLKSTPECRSISPWPVVFRRAAFLYRERLNSRDQDQRLGGK